MKEKTKPQSASITGPLLAAITAQDKASFAANFHAPTVGSTPLLQPALYQDPGSGYNANFIFPQD
jgi:hypothetical protein